MHEDDPTPAALRLIGTILDVIDSSDPRVAALQAVLAIAGPASSNAPAATNPVPPTSPHLISAAEAARASGLTKEAMVKRLRRLRIGQKVGARWYVDREALRMHCPEFRD